MSSVLDRSALEESPLADLHLLANELGVDGFRRLRSAELIDAIVGRQTGERRAGADAPTTERARAPRRQPPRPPRPRRRRRRRRGQGRRDEAAAAAPAPRRAAAAATAARRDRRGRRAEPPRRRPPSEDSVVEGVVELLGNGSASCASPRPSPPTTTSTSRPRRSSAASSSRATASAGPLRPPRRSERFPSLVRVDTINGRPADEVAEGTRFEDLPAAFPDERLELGADDPTVKAIEWLTPFGKGSRVVITGAPRAGKSEALRRIAAALAAHEGLDVSVVLCGVRPEEIREWDSPVAALGLAAPPDAQAQAVEQAVEQGRRVASRGGDAVVIIDTLDGLAPAAARRALAAARNIVDGGSLTVIATAALPLGGETTVVTLDSHAHRARRFPALDLAHTGTLRPELLVGEAGAEAIARARVEAASA